MLDFFSVAQMQIYRNILASSPRYEHLAECLLSQDSKDMPTVTVFFCSAVMWYFHMSLAQTVVKKRGGLRALAIKIEETMLVISIQSIRLTISVRGTN